MELHLASMENVTCWAYRQLVKGATDSYTGIFSANYLVNRHKAWKEIDTFPIHNQRQWLQIASAKEAECKELLSVMDKELSQDPEKDSVYGIQLNASCPSPMIINLGQGPALIKRPVKVFEILKALLKQDKYKVSIKTRLGLDAGDVVKGKVLKLFEWIEKVGDPNLTQVVVHFKHAREPSFKEYSYSFLKPLTEFKIPIVINGGINSLADFTNITKEVKNKKNIAGFMMGREALRNPDCFIESAEKLNSKKFDFRTKEQVRKEFEELCLKHSPREIYLETIKKLCPWNS